MATPGRAVRVVLAAVVVGCGALLLAQDVISTWLYSWLFISAFIGIATLFGPLRAGIAQRLFDTVIAVGAASVGLLTKPEALFSARGHLSLLLCVGVSFVAGTLYRHGRIAQVWHAAHTQGAEHARAGIARHLHDGTLQTLVAARMGLRNALTSKDESKLEEASSLAAQLLDEQIHTLRDLSHELMPSRLDKEGLAAAVEHLADQVSRSWGRPVAVVVAGARDTRAAPVAELTAYRVIQEALNNTVRHSGATRATVRLRLHRYCLLAEIQDDGEGFDTDTPPQQGIGLSGMRERVVQCEGSITVRSRTAETAQTSRAGAGDTGKLSGSQHGTTVRFLLPARPGGQRPAGQAGAAAASEPASAPTLAGRGASTPAEPAPTVQRTRRTVQRTRLTVRGGRVRGAR
ncbi:histidine kinase [Streptomyces tubbatahanensis]|uniref:Histidine kinase n=1 Tax=Streptomyces tubbatahanensis TaxID=2923272 RepID=A0ABY3XX64_9ACTN|nr:ATP-binding protein [Streptomyces tubbatahanensis]UNS99094.1 histidine kinase [Streptomyces tubbatahanensis]